MSLFRHHKEKDDDELVRKLTEMGINQNSAKYALKRMNGDVERAANFVFSGESNREEANDLILGALNRNPHSPGFHKSPSASSLTNKTGGALAALGLKSMAPAFGTFSGSQESLPVPTQNIRRTSLEDAKPSVKIVNDTSVEPGREQASIYPASKEKERGRSRTSGRDRYKKSLSPFFSRRSLGDGSAGLGMPRSRDTSPVGALSEPAESDGESVGAYRPKSTAFSAKRQSTGSDSDDDSDYETETEYDDSVLSRERVMEDGWIEDVFDDETEKNTEANAIYLEGDAAGLGGTGTLEDENGQEIEVEVDALGEGPNVILPPEPVFQQSTMTRRPPTPPTDDGSKKKKSSKFEPVDLITGRPEFGRNRCTIRLTQGDPDEALEKAGTRLRSYVVLSDLSEEAGYALQWAIGTVARDGDELLVTTVMETDSKVDPKNPSDQDRAAKLRVQKERQGVALQLVRQVTGLLQRTKLNITVTCQAIHSKNARHMLLDLIDYLEPTMVIVGSRGLGKLSGILLGSTSHYLVQKSSVPVMVARRRLKKPLRKTDPALLRHAPRVSLASASIEKSASKKQEDDILDAGELERAGEQEDKDNKEKNLGGFGSTAS